MTYKLGRHHPDEQAHPPSAGLRRPRLQDRAREVHRRRRVRSSSTTNGAVRSSPEPRASRRATPSRDPQKEEDPARGSTPSSTRRSLVVAQAGRKGAITVSTTWPVAARHHPRWQPMPGSSSGEQAADPHRGRGVASVRSTEASSKKRGDEVREAGGLHIVGNHRAPRVTPHRQPGSSEMRGSPGRPRLLHLLPVPSRTIRHLAGDRAKARGRQAMRRSMTPIEHPWVSEEHPGRAAQGRGAQLRHPREPARVRRRQRTKALHGTPCRAGRGGEASEKVKDVTEI